MVLVKKYANRRLYDTEESRYVTLDELAGRIRRGADVRVFDAETNEDLTQAILTQIIIENRKAARMLPVGLLIQLIRMGDDALAEFLGQYMTTALDLYLRAKQGANALAPFNPFANIPFATTSALARMLLAGGLGWGETSPPPPPEPSPSPPPPPPPPPSTSPSSSELAELRREIGELKRSMQAATGKSAAAPRRRRK
jgi:polyhydroxyalkanoate synthesis repressor PhaR